MHKMVYGTAPLYLQELVPPTVGELNPYSRRFANNLSDVSCRTELYHKTFLLSTVEDWNALPLDIRRIDNYNTFKFRISRKPSKTNCNYYFGERKENILHARLRMECSALKVHLYKIHVVDSAICHCLAGN